MIYCAILGYGVVGSGVAELLYENTDYITSSVNETLQLKKIIDLRSFPGNQFEDIISCNFEEVLNDKEISVVAETIGGKKVAYEYTKKLLSAGKSVVTSNKELVADKGEELLQIAANNGVHYLYEAAVGGAIPVLKTEKESLSHNRIQKIQGILNGTTNFILTQIKEKGISFADALATAQNLGYAEKDPTADIKGLDACRKIAILADIAYGETVDPLRIETHGIEEITPTIMKAAESKGYAIKLIGYAEKKNKGLVIFVSPCAIPFSNPLARIDDVFNGVTLSCDFAGDITLIGRGAGSRPTASAVVADMIDACKTNPRSIPQWISGTSPVYGLDELKLPVLNGTKIPIL